MVCQSASAAVCRVFIEKERILILFVEIACLTTEHVFFPLLKEEDVFRCLFLCILEHSASVTLDYTHLLDESLTRTYSKSVKIVSHRLKVALIQFMAWMSDSALFLCFINSIEMITFLNNKRQLKILNEIK